MGTRCPSTVHTAPPPPPVLAEDAAAHSVVSYGEQEVGADGGLVSQSCKNDGWVGAEGGSTATQMPPNVVSETPPLQPTVDVLRTYAALPDWTLVAETNAQPAAIAKTTWIRRTEGSVPRRQTK